MARPPSLRRSCMACALAKRRCDLKTPKCSRCFSRAVTCAYANEPLFSPSDPSAGLGTPLERPHEDNQESAVFLPSNPVPSDLDFMTLFTLDTLNQYPSLSSPIDLISSSITLPAVDITGPHNAGTIAYLVNEIQSYPTTFVYQSKTPFIHPRLCYNRTPQVLQDAFTVCAVYLTINASNKSTVFQIMETKEADLLQQDCGPSCSIADNLACVQALILVRIVQLFDGDIRQRALAERSESILATWTEQLHSRTKGQSVNSPSQGWLSWIFAESVRRTILMSHLLRALYSSLKLGFCAASLTVAPLMFTAQAALWDLPLGNFLQDLESAELPPVMSYYDFVVMWDRGHLTQTTPFERFLLVACKGEHCVEILNSDPQCIEGTANL